MIVVCSAGLVAFAAKRSEKHSAPLTLVTTMTSYAAIWASVASICAGSTSGSIRVSGSSTTCAPSAVNRWTSSRACPAGRVTTTRRPARGRLMET